MNVYCFKTGVELKIPADMPGPDGRQAKRRKTEHPSSARTQQLAPKPETASTSTGSDVPSPTLQEFRTAPGGVYSLYGMGGEAVRKNDEAKME